MVLTVMIPSSEPSDVGNNGAGTQRQRIHSPGHGATIHAIEQRTDQSTTKAAWPTQLSGKARRQAASHLHGATLEARNPSQPEVTDRLGRHREQPEPALLVDPETAVARFRPARCR